LLITVNKAVADRAAAVRVAARGVLVPVAVTVEVGVIVGGNISVGISVGGRVGVRLGNGVLVGTSLGCGVFVGGITGVMVAIVVAVMVAVGRVIGVAGGNGCIAAGSKILLIATRIATPTPSSATGIRAGWRVDGSESSVLAR